LLVAALAGLLQGSPSAPLRSLEKGSQSFVDDMKQVTARTADEWNAVWKQHAPGRPAPEVDFSREMVVGIFVGSRNSAGYAVEIVGVEKLTAGPAGIIVRYKETVPGRAAVTAQIVTSPYHLVAVPRQDGLVKFEKVE
jgi:PrcB C-terminal